MEVNTNADYFPSTSSGHRLTDALGSVRQLTDATGTITYARAYDPYGVVTSTAGTTQTSYGYTDEFTSNEMVYLRARYYTPGTGRFLTRDTWGGNANSPMSYNRWNYTDSNPINRTDPSGNCWYPNLQAGGISIDISIPSSNICPWFIDAFEQLGASIPTNATRDNWMDTLPPNVKSIILSHNSCVGNQVFFSQGQDYWMVVRFYTRPNWEYYQSTSSTSPPIQFKLLAGAEAVFSCDNQSHECTASGKVDIGARVGSVFGFELGVSAGVGAERDIYTGSIRVGATASAGPCDLFLGFTKISLGCTHSLTLQTFEIGWTRDALPEEYWVLTKSSTYSSLSYEDFAELYLPFRGKSKIYHRIEDTNHNYMALRYKYSNFRLYVID